MKRQNKHLEGLIALLLFGVFAVCMMMVLLTGAETYHRMTQRDQQAYCRRTCTQYIATQVRQSDALDAASVAPFGQGDALLLAEEIEGARYIRRIYLYDGYLMELFSQEETELEPRDGEKIMELSGLQLSLENGWLEVRCTDDQGVVSRLTLSMRSGEEAAR